MNELLLELIFKDQTKAVTVRDLQARCSRGSCVYKEGGRVHTGTKSAPKCFRARGGVIRKRVAEQSCTCW